MSFEGTLLTGSEHNDEFYRDEAGQTRTRTNRSFCVIIFCANKGNVLCGKHPEISPHPPAPSAKLGEREPDCG